MALPSRLQALPGHRTPLMNSRTHPAVVSQAPTGGFSIPEGLSRQLRLLAHAGRRPPHPRTRRAVQRSVGEADGALVKGDLVALLNRRGIEMDLASTNVERNDGGRRWEIDILAVNGAELVVLGQFARHGVDSGGAATLR